MEGFVECLTQYNKLKKVRLTPLILASLAALFFLVIIVFRNRCISMSLQRFEPCSSLPSHLPLTTVLKNLPLSLIIITHMSLSIKLILLFSFPSKQLDHFFSNKYMMVCYRWKGSKMTTMLWKFNMTITKTTTYSKADDTMERKRNPNIHFS